MKKAMLGRHAWSCLGVVSAALVLAPSARADEPPATPAPSTPPAAAPEEARPPPPAFEPAIAPEGPPLGRRGFQAALRTGVAIPSGLVAGRTSRGEELPMNEALSLQIPLLVDVGWKVIPNLFLGLYGGLAFGSSDYSLCARESCSVLAKRLGVQVQYHIAPAEQLNPWVGYGLGLEAFDISHENGAGCSSTAGASGLEWGHFMGGIDLRLSKHFGFGPFIDFSAGTYTSQTRHKADCYAKFATSGVANDTFANGSIENTATHYWLTLGARAVLFP